MVSLRHEGLIKLVRDRPAFAADLLDELLAVKVPPFSKARLVDVTLNQVKPAEYRADAVVLFTRGKPTGVRGDRGGPASAQEAQAIHVAALRGRSTREGAMPVRGAGGDAKHGDREVGGEADRPGGGISSARTSSGQKAFRS
jgi:hypothetical protein